MSRVRRFSGLATLVIALCAPTFSPAAAAKGPGKAGKSPSQAARIEALEARLSGVLDVVERLEKRLEQSETRRRELESKPALQPTVTPATATPAASSDPLAELESQLGGAGGPSKTGRGTTAPRAAGAAGTGAAGTDPLAGLERDLATVKSAPLGNPRTAFNPQISVIADFVYSNSSLDEDPALLDPNGVPRGDANRDRFSLRELEVAFQSSIDPFSRLDVFLELPGVLEEFEDDAAAAREPKIEVEEAYVTYWRLPFGLQLKGGKFRLELGKNNREHNDNQHAITRPEVIRAFLGGEGLAEQGLSLQKFIPVGGPETQIELTGQLLNGEGGEETLFAATGSDKTMTLARARLYHDISSSTNIDLGHSQLWGHHDPAGAFRQRIRQYDFSLRHEPVGSSVYKQFIFRIEHFQGDRHVPLDLDGDGLPEFVGNESPDGTYVMAQYQWDRFWNVGLRYDNTATALRAAENAADGDPFLRDRAVAGLDRIEGRSIWVTYLNSEFSKFRLQYTRREANFPLILGKESEDMVTAQWIVAVGPHGAHKY